MKRVWISIRLEDEHRDFRSSDGESAGFLIKN